jgi:ParB family chromosome partitioning protein
MALEQLPLSKIRAAEDQPRKTFYSESLEELASSIKERGVLEPIVVRPLKGAKGTGPQYQIVMGERRFRASKIAGLENIPAIIREYSDEEAAADALLENFQREDLNPVEKARAVQSLLKMLALEKVCKTLGVSETTVRRLLELLELPPHVQAELVSRPMGGGGQIATSDTGTFAEGHARALIALNDDPSTQIRLVQKVKQEKLSVAALEQIISAIGKYPTKKEVFLHVPANVSDQMIRSLSAIDERKKPYKSQTAREHVKAIDKHSVTMTNLLDERVIEYLTAEEMNQLLASVAQASRVIDQFTAKVREALENKDFGFSETYIHCPLCGRIELVGSVRCSTCWTILRRCYDCGNYDRGGERCGKFGVTISLAEAEGPKEHSKSYKCRDYRPKFTPQGLKLKMAVGK